MSDVSRIPTSSTGSPERDRTGGIRRELGSSPRVSKLGSPCRPGRALTTLCYGQSGALVVISQPKSLLDVGFGDKGASVSVRTRVYSFKTVYDDCDDVFTLAPFPKI